MMDHPKPVQPLITPEQLEELGRRLGIPVGAQMFIVGQVEPQPEDDSDPIDLDVLGED